MTFEEKHHAMVQYLLMKVDEQDWHGVSDAANDLRELEADHYARLSVSSDHCRS